MKPVPMKTSLLPAGSARRFLLAAACALGAAGASAQPGPVQLAPVVTTATRLPESSAVSGTAIDVVSGVDLARQQLATFADALAGVPGAPAFPTGQAGAVTSLFLRGANSNQTLFLVDGIRLNDANTDYNNFLGGARIFPTDTIEIARGPQSTLYGSEAVGGVISLHQVPGTGPATETAQVEAGSFGTIDGLVTAQAGRKTWGYNLAASAEQTDNTRVNNRFKDANVALRLDDQPTSLLRVGATLRGLAERYQDPGDEFTNNLFNYEREQNWLGTVFADARLTENLLSHLILGGQDRRFVAVVPTPGRPDAVTVVKNLRGVLDWQVTGRLTEHNILTAGITADTGSTVNTGFGAISRHQTLFGVFGDDEWTPFPDLHLTGGLRHDDYNTFGGATTGRTTLAWQAASALKLRGSYGTGFDAPSFLDLYGKSAFFVGNPAVKPERSHGWDAGLDYTVPGRQDVLSATWFENRYSNLIVDNFKVFPGTTANVERARSRGLELSLSTLLFNVAKAKIAYTYLEARNLSENIPLLRRPRNSLSADVYSDLGHGWLVGAGGAYVGHRPDVDARTFATVDDPGYSVVRAYASCQVSGPFALKVRVENALDRRYEPVNGYPQPGTGIFGSAELRF
jgi:vitamin B12 transporter